MCGIAGYLGSGSREQLSEMLDAIRHRGPDDAGMLLKGGVGFAHARLSVIDTSSAGHQPMEGPDDTVITFNGEIYNYEELRKELIVQGIALRSSTDTEVLLWLYKLHGEDFLSRCTGMFSFALYDAPAHKLILARDRMGEKPLYWCEVNGTIWFASELRALLSLKALPKKLDHESIAQYLACDYIPTPRSVIEGVHKLEPATMLIVTGHSQEKRRYWRPPDRLTEMTTADAAAQLETHLSRSVARQLATSDVPTGIFLSGGLDSSTVAYYAQRASTRPIDTFSIAFSEPTFDESEYARAVAAHIGSHHHEEHFTSEAALELVSELPEVLSEPVADASILPTMLLSRFARKTVTVALGGDGADELFAGYPTFRADSLFNMYRKLPRPLQGLLYRAAQTLPTNHQNFSLSYSIRKALSSDADDDVIRHMEWLSSFPRAEIRRILGPSMHASDIEHVYDFATEYARDISSDNGNALLYAYARTYLMDEVLVKVDRASMRYALETRAPFLDHAVVEFVVGLPYSFKYRSGTTKYLLKQLMRDKLPSGIVDRRKKGFGIPLAQWLTGPLRCLADELLSETSLNTHGLFDVKRVAELKDQHMQKKRDNRKELWNLMVFQLWYDRWMR